jgi:hypothetical protein
LHSLSTSFILGYHGSDAEVAEKLLSGDPFDLSNNTYDWLGRGIYFWEANPERGIEFANEQSRRASKSIKQPSVVGAVLDLGYCLDLTTGAGIQVVKDAYASLKRATQAAEKSLPKNRRDRFMHDLDCAVINHLHAARTQQGLRPFDSVKGLFVEGKRIFPNSEFREKNHIQVAVLNSSQIKGVFRVLPSQFEFPKP